MPNNIESNFFTFSIFGLEKLKRIANSKLNPSRETRLVLEQAEKISPRPVDTNR
jgi:hypothetical protein